MERTGKGIDRRTLLIGGGAGIGLVVAWAVWPRAYLPNLSVRDKETAFGAWLKIAANGQVTVAIPQCEYGQGVFTALPQVLADIHEFAKDDPLFWKPAVLLEQLVAEGRNFDSLNQTT